jgi:hypothetical protein
MLSKTEIVQNAIRGAAKVDVLLSIPRGETLQTISERGLASFLPEFIGGANSVYSGWFDNAMDDVMKRQYPSPEEFLWLKTAEDADEWVPQVSLIEFNYRVLKEILAFNPSTGLVSLQERQWAIGVAALENGSLGAMIDIYDGILADALRDGGRDAHSYASLMRGQRFPDMGAMEGVVMDSLGVYSSDLEFPLTDFLSQF